MVNLSKMKKLKCIKDLKTLKILKNLQYVKNLAKDNLLDFDLREFEGKLSLKIMHLG